MLRRIEEVDWVGDRFLGFLSLDSSPVLRKPSMKSRPPGACGVTFLGLYLVCALFLRDTDKTDYGLLCGTYDGRMIVRIGIISLIEARFCYWQSASAVGNPTTRLSPQWRQLSIPVDFHRSWEGKVRSLILCHIQDHTVRSYNLLDLALRSGSTP